MMIPIFIRCDLHEWPDSPHSPLPSRIFTIFLVDPEHLQSSIFPMQLQSKTISALKQMNIFSFLQCLNQEFLRL